MFRHMYGGALGLFSDQQPVQKFRPPALEVKEWATMSRPCRNPIPYTRGGTNKYIKSGVSPRRSRIVIIV